VKIGSVKGKNISNSAKYYSFTDNKVSEGKYAYRLKQIDNNGKYEYSQVVELQYGGVSPEKFEMLQNYPNPFNPITNISYQLPKATNVQLKIYNILGNEIAVLVNSVQPAGVYNLPFNGSNLSSGLYIAKLSADGFVKTIKMNLIK